MGKAKTDDDVHALLDDVRVGLGVDVIFVLQNVGLKYDFEYSIISTGQDCYDIGGTIMRYSRRELFQAMAQYDDRQQCDVPAVSDPLASQFSSVLRQGIFFDDIYYGAVGLLRQEPTDWTPETREILSRLSDVLKNYIALRDFRSNLRRIQKDTVASELMRRSYFRISDIFINRDLIVDIHRDAGESASAELSAPFSENIAACAEKYVHPSNRAVFKQILSKEYLEKHFSRSRENISFTYQRLVSGVYRWVQSEVIPVDDYSDTNAHVMWFVRNITEQKAREEKWKRSMLELNSTLVQTQNALTRALKNSNELFKELIELLRTAVIAYDIDKQAVIVMNAAALNLFGYDSIASFEGKFSNLKQRIISDNRDTLEDELFSTMETSEILDFEITVTPDTEHIIHVLAQAKKIQLASGTRLLVFAMTDISDRIEMHRKLLLLSKTDSLTGLSNRRSGEEDINLLLKQRNRGLFCLLDVDYFKHVNDAFGHAVGDKVLTAISGTLRDSFRRGDVVMRLGGDEFATYSPFVTSREIGLQLLHRLQKNVSEIDIPEMQGEKISISIGAVITSDSNLNTFDNVYKNADDAMYHSKKNGRGQFTLRSQ
ncbi:MAG: diguanylate cyclase [Selenomonadaceae bacterium]|nr:diguanylate cyclase [Selenomonadaceae bacterium]